MRISKKFKKHIIVIGGGFAGHNFIKELYNNPFYSVTLIDRNNYNYFTPLLYQVATSFLEPSSICYPFRKLFKDKEINFRNAALVNVDTIANKIHLSDGGELSYDYLVFAAGSKTNFFGNESIRRNAFSLKGIDDALHLRNELIKTFEAASIETDPVERQKLLTIVIAGGGPTGVEVGGVLAEMKQHILRKDYPEFKHDTLRVYVIDGAPYLLAPMSNKSHIDAECSLRKLDVDVILDTQVTLFENNRVYLSNGETIDARTLIWSAGVIANTFDGISKHSLGKGNRMVTDAFNKVEGYDTIYAIGDISIQHHDRAYGHGHPQLAQPAIQQGRLLARNLLAVARGKRMKPFIYFDKGDMAIIGRYYAVADLFKNRFHLHGFIGLMGWLFIHLMALATHNNKIKTFYNWAVAYITCDQSLRMIFRADQRENRKDEITRPNHVADHYNSMHHEHVK